MLREIGHIQGVAHTLNNLGSVQENLGLLTEALASYTEAHAHAAEIGDHCVEAYALNNIGNVHRQQGRLTQAVRYHDKAQEVAANVPDADLRTQLYLDRGATALARGARGDALTPAKRLWTWLTAAGTAPTGPALIAASPKRCTRWATTRAPSALGSGRGRIRRARFAGSRGSAGGTRGAGMRLR